MGLSLRRARPSVWALTYCVIASLAVAASCFFQGTLFHEKLVRIGANTFVQHSYTTNISSILDFAILNPIAIYFLIRATDGFKVAYTHFKAGRQISRFDRAGFIAVSVAIGVSTMWYYFQGFVGGKFFTEAFEPTVSGTASISWTGWIIFSATSLFISLVAFVAAEFANYILFVRRLTPRDIRVCLPPTVSADIKMAISPCLSVAYALAALFVVLALFVFRDFFQFDIRQSWRVWLFAPYLLICLVAFLPFWHLHEIMAKQLGEMIATNNRIIEEDISLSDNEDKALGLRFDPRKLVVSVDKIEKLQSFYSSIPTWPAKANDLIFPNVSVVMSLATLAYKIFDTVRASIK